jgi:hypothetical protein
MNRKKILLFCLFIISRIIFINPLPVFFDSPEYLSRFSNPNFLQAITSGHSPFHVGYIMLLWPIFQLAKFLNINPSSSIIFAQIIIASIAMYCFYRLIEMLTNKRVAIIAAIICALMPLYWIMNASIMTESTCINFSLISFYFFALYSKRKIYSTGYLLTGFLSFGLALLTDPLAILWTPLIFSIIYFFKREKVGKFTLLILLTSLLVMLINSSFISYSFGIPILNGIYQYLFGTDIAIIPNISHFTVMLFRFVRNAFIPILQNNTAIIVILSFISLVKLFKNNKKIFIISFLWIVPTILTNQLFDPLLFGRHGAIASFGFGFLTAVFLEKRKLLSVLVVAYIAIASLPALILLKQPIPYLEMGKFIQTLPKGLLIDTHFSRPQTEGLYSGEITYINQPGWSQNKLKNAIDGYLDQQKRVFISSQALSEPYGTYSGPYLYPLSLSYAKSFELSNIIPLYTTKEYAAIDDTDIIIYEIVSRNASRYPDIPILTYSRRTINYCDPINQLWPLILKELRLSRATT